MNIKGKTFSQVANKISKIPIVEVLHIGRNALREVAKKKNWRRLKTGIKDEKITNESGRIYVDENRKDPDGPTNNEVAAFLDQGTDDHEVKPVNKKALFWKGKVVVSKGPAAKMKTQGFFSKGHTVIGIKAMHWFILMDSTREKINKFVSDFITKAKNG